MLWWEMESWLKTKKWGIGGKRLRTLGLDHNFWTRNPSKSSKVSKDSNCSQVSKARWSGPRPGEVGQDGL